MNENSRRTAGTPRLSTAGELSDAPGIPRLSATNEDYLEAIYALGEESGVVRCVDLAAHLDVSKASVNRAVSTLKQAGLVLQPHYGDLSLTEEGSHYAASILERHIVLNRFLIDVLGVDEEVAGSEACMMEHAISADTLQRLLEFVESYSTA
jgi:Mn-dependent DtxR family transcriptional regulator